MQYLFKLFIYFIFFLSPSISFTQNTLSGYILQQEDNAPIKFATVKLKNAKQTLITNELGFFEFKNLQGNDFLEITASGYVTRVLKLSQQKTITILLDKNIRSLSDVVVTSGYSKPKRREEVVGSIATVTASELQTNRPLESLDKMLQGLAAGVQVQTGTELGTPVKINIRGQNSLSDLSGSNSAPRSTSSQPLFIIDGVPVNEQRKGDEPIAFISGEQLLNPLANINPDDIESISVLKDAAATSIYGANANNGVVIITTKKGSKKGTVINVNYQAGMAKPINRMKWLDGPKFYELLNELYLNEGVNPLNAALQAGSSNINTNWFELLNQYAAYHNVDANISGGNDATQFRFSVSYLNQNAAQQKNYLQKIYAKLRIDHAISKKLNLGISLSPTFSKQSLLNSYNDVPIMPNLPVYNADGSFYELSTLGVPNPLAVLKQNKNTSEGGALNGNFKLEYGLLKNLKLTATYGIDALLNKQEKFFSGKNATGRTKNGFAEIYDRNNFNWVQNAQANWYTKLMKKNSLDIIVGYEIQNQTAKLLKGSATGFSYYRSLELSSAQNQESASSKQITKLFSIYSQASYVHNAKYFLSLSARRDASSVFGTEIKSTTNGAVGLGYILSKEKFFDNIDWINLFRVRTSYGTTGNNRISGYEAASLYNFTLGYNNYVAGNPTSAPNPNLSWEKGRKTNLGIDFNILNKVNITFDAYKNLTLDAISSVDLNPATGFSSVLANVGDLQNKGWDLQIKIDWFNKSKLNWNTTLNAGYNKNLVTKVKNDISKFSATDQAAVLKKDVSTTAIWGFEFAGVNPSNGKEQYYTKNKTIVDVDALDNTITEGYKIGDKSPKLFGGFNNNIGYKNLNLSFLIIYEIDGDYLVPSAIGANSRNIANANQTINLINRWQKPGDITTIPKLDRRIKFVTNTSKLVFDNTHIKLGNLSFSFKTQKGWIKKWEKMSASFFMNASNIFYWYKQKSPDGLNGIREYRFSFPESQTFTLGTNLNF